MSAKNFIYLCNFFVWWPYVLEVHIISISSFPNWLLLKININLMQMHTYWEDKIQEFILWRWHQKKKKNQSDCLQCRQGHRPQLEEGTQDNWPEPMHEFVLRSSCCQRVLQQQWCLKSMPRKWDLIFWSLIEHEKIRHMWLVSKYEVTVVSNCLSNIFIKLPRVTNACCAAISN